MVEVSDDELAYVSGAAWLEQDVKPDEPVKVSIGLRGKDAATDLPRKVILAGPEPDEFLGEDTGLKDSLTKERLLRENSALKEALLQQQQQQLEEMQSMKQLWSPSHWHYTAGDAVVFQGLQREKRLNGQTAVIDRWDSETERWVVQTSTGEEKFVKPENLVAAYSWPMCLPNGLLTCPVPLPSEVAGQQGTSSNPKPISRTASWASTTASCPTEYGDLTNVNPSSFGSSDGGSDEEKTTVMMRNIPNDYSREMFLKLLDNQGFRGQYDLVYLPIDYTSNANLGYAFINLTSHAQAMRFRKKFDSFSRWGVTSRKVAEVCWSAALQGVQAHIDRYRNSSVMHEAVREEFKPALFENGRPVPFPRPTRAIRPPRTHKGESK